MTRRDAWTVFLVAVACAAWFAAGWRSGLARGRGWRAAVIESGCGLVCPPPPPPRPAGTRL